jgi:hypothetical protein
VADSLAVRAVADALDGGVVGADPTDGVAGVGSVRRYGLEGAIVGAVLKRIAMLVTALVRITTRLDANVGDGPADVAARDHILVIFNRTDDRRRRHSRRMARVSGVPALAG